jgi:thiamine pyrophosphokinase
MGFGGGRPDHLLAGLIEVGDFAARAPRNVSSITWDDGDARYHFLSARLPRSELALRKGQTVSVFAWHSTVRGLTLTGFAYPLRRATLTPSSGGLSNRATKTRCVISLESGRLLVVLPRRLNYS